ncbi:MAG: DUF4230 domain-containing protein [Pontixanthobacter sp.]
MDDTIMHEEPAPRDHTDAAKPEKPAKEPSLARVQGVPWLIVILLLALSAWLAWRAFIFKEEDDPVGLAVAAFEAQGELTVYSSRFEVTAQSTNETSLGPIDIGSSEQVAVVPATVDYRVNLASVGRDRLAWNDGDDVLEVTLPPVKISAPDLDAARTKSYTDGRFVTGGASKALARNNMLIAERKAAAFAKDGEVLAQARASAKQAVAQNLTIPLKVAGYDDITVNVRFDGEKAPGS